MSEDEEQRLIREFKESQERAEKDAEDEDKVKYEGVNFSEALRQKGFNENRPPISSSEKEKMRNVQNELSMYTTVSPVETESGIDRKVLNPYDPNIQAMNKYFVYKNTNTGEWIPTQHSYILYWMAAYASTFGLDKYLDRSVILKTPKNHPYKGRYRYPDSINPFKKEMEDRINKDFPKIMQNMANVVWKTNYKDDGGMTYIAPIEPGSHRGHTKSVEIRFDEDSNSFTLKGPKDSVRIPSTYVQQESEMKPVIRKLLSRSELYSNLKNTLSTLNVEINQNIIKEILQNNKELNFIRRTPEQKEAVKGAIIESISELIEFEIRKIMQEEA